jgi:hypothetical protein
VTRRDSARREEFDVALFGVTLPPP